MNYSPANPIACYKIIDSPEHRDNEPLGLLYMLGSLALFTLTMILNRTI